MTSPEPASDQIEPARADVDVLVVGAGITGIYQLYRAREAGFSVQLLEAGDGVGGTWYWNRYPGARFDSESYTYAYLFSKELFEEWEWQEHFAEQPEIERYLNHVVDRFDLRRHMRFDAKVTSAVYDESSGTWTVAASDGTELRTRFFIAATGVLSVPYFPDVPGREDFRGESYHTGLWPTDAGRLRRQAGCRHRHRIERRTGDPGHRRRRRLADGVPAHRQLVHTAEQRTDHPRGAGATQGRLRVDARDAEHLAVPGSSTPRTIAPTFDDSTEERLAFFEKMWSSPGFSKLTSNYTDLMFDHAANALWCEFIAEKIRGIVEDPETAEKLIPTDHRFAEKRPPFVTGLLRGVQPARTSRSSTSSETPIVRVTEGGIETAEGVREFDIIVWATGFDFGTGALTRHGHPRPRRPCARGRLGGRSADVPRHPEHGLPESLLPGRPACGSRQQPAVQRRPGGLHHGHPRLSARPRLRHHRSGPRSRGAVDRR